jgi:hypothetical protein
MLSVVRRKCGKGEKRKENGQLIKIKVVCKCFYRRREETERDRDRDRERERELEKTMHTTIALE